MPLKDELADLLLDLTDDKETKIFLDKPMQEDVDFVEIFTPEGRELYDKLLNLIYKSGRVSGAEAEADNLAEALEDDCAYITNED